MHGSINTIFTSSYVTYQTPVSQHSVVCASFSVIERDLTSLLLKYTSGHPIYGEVVILRTICLLIHLII
jgi:hypothetical protein